MSVAQIGGPEQRRTTAILASGERILLMGMHFGLVAIRGTVSNFKTSFPKVWPKFEITASAEGFADAEAVWSWMKAHEHFVSAAAWTKDNPGSQCAYVCQFGPWTVFMDPSYVLASDEKALKQLSELHGIVLSFIIETAGGCAYFWCYESGQLRRAIFNGGEEVRFEGNPLPEESDLDARFYYMQETEALMRAFGLPALEALPVPAETTALALTDRTDYGELKKNPASGQPAARSTERGPSRDSGTAAGIATTKPWWKFW